MVCRGVPFQSLGPIACEGAFKGRLKDSSAGTYSVRMGPGFSNRDICNRELYGHIASALSINEL